MRRYTRLAVAASMALWALAVAGPASSRPGGLAADSTYTSGPDTYAPLPCPGANADGVPKHGICLGTAHGKAVYHGRLEGHSTYAYGYSVDAAGRYIAESTELFTGRVRGCGRGTALIVNDDVTGANLIGHATWMIRAGTGTGGLARLHGHGRARTTYDAASKGHGHLQGQLSCR